MSRSRRLIVSLFWLACGGCRLAAVNGLSLDGSGAANGPPWTDAFPALDGTPAGFALSFDGVMDYATAGNAGFPAASAAQTVELWVDTPATSVTADFVVMRTYLMEGVQIGVRNGTVAVWRTSGGEILVKAPAPPSASTWHHVAYTFDQTTHTLYVDGVVADAETAASDSRTPNTVWLGTLDGTNELFKGEMDEVRVWSVARSAGEVRTDMRHSPPGPVSGLVAYWTFDDVHSRGRAVDASGSGNDVTLGDGIAARMPSRVPSDAPVGP
jgi:Concanavalin A-like lectin/glucanases superfamily